jgi:hypothetical protein
VFHLVIVEVIKVIEKHFQRWDYQAVQELEQICRTIPILPHDKAMAFFSRSPDETRRESGRTVQRAIFESLMGVVSASDRKDFSVTCELSSGAAANGVLMLETFDRSIGVLFCVARISKNSFLTHALLESDDPSIKGLRTAQTAQNSDNRPSTASSDKGFWQRLFGK